VNCKLLQIDFDQIHVPCILIEFEANAPPRPERR